MSDVASLAARVALLEDERGIRAALERYGHSIDYGLEADWVDCFTPDGVYDLRIRVQQDDLAKYYPYAKADPGGLRFTGKDQLAKFAAGHTRPPALHHKHIVCDHVVTRDGNPDGARVTSYFLRVDEVDGRREIVAFGRYHDTLKRCTDGRWRFVERLVDLESNAPR